MRRLAAALAAALLWAAAPAVAAQPKPVAVEVVRDEAGTFTADYRLGRKAGAWAFLRSALTREGRKPWRPQSFTILTPGVRFERRGFYDLLVADKGKVPERVQIRFTPSTLDLEADYDPALVFSTGAVALFTDMFDVAPLPSPAAAEALGFDDVALHDSRTLVTFRDEAGEVLHAGRRKASVTAENGRSYVLFGPAEIAAGADIASIVDPALPAWLAAEMTDGTRALLADYARQLGPRKGERPMLMATWAGADSKGASMGGSVLPGLVLMAFEGARLAGPSKPALDYIRWFTAHEAAHFWLGQTVDYDSPEHAWMMEGGADLLAVRTIAAAHPDYDPNVRLNGQIAACTKFAEGRPVDTAYTRGEHDAYYACGAVFGLVVEAAARKSGGSFATFWRGLIEANRDDGEVSAAEWLAALDQVSADPALSAGIRRLADDGVADPRAEIVALFRRAGVAFEEGADGAIRLE